jgi:hypothetical protein
VDCEESHTVEAVGSITESEANARANIATSGGTTLARAYLFVGDYGCKGLVDDLPVPPQAARLDGHSRALGDLEGGDQDFDCFASMSVPTADGYGLSGWTGTLASNSSLSLRDASATPGGSVSLSDRLIESGGVGDSGRAIDADVSGLRAKAATTQWVGCDGEPAWADFGVRGETRFTATLDKRDFTGVDLTFTVRVRADGVVLRSIRVANAGVPIDIGLPRGTSVIRLEAEVLSGTCGAAPDGYLYWGDGALS